MRDKKVKEFFHSVSVLVVFCFVLVARPCGRAFDYFGCVRLAQSPLGSFLFLTT